MRSICLTTLKRNTEINSNMFSSPDNNLVQVISQRFQGTLPTPGRNQ